MLVFGLEMETEICLHSSSLSQSACLGNSTVFDADILRLFA